MNILQPKAGDRFTVTYRGHEHRYEVLDVDADGDVNYQCAGRGNWVSLPYWRALFTRVTERGGKITEGK